LIPLIAFAYPSLLQFPVAGLDTLDAFHTTIIFDPSNILRLIEIIHSYYLITPTTTQQQAAVGQQQAQQKQRFAGT